MDSPKLILTLTDAISTIDLGENDDDVLNEVSRHWFMHYHTQWYQSACIE